MAVAGCPQSHSQAAAVAAPSSLSLLIERLKSLTLLVQSLSIETKEDLLEEEEEEEEEAIATGTGTGAVIGGYSNGPGGGVAGGAAGGAGRTGSTGAAAAAAAVGIGAGNPGGRSSGRSRRSCIERVVRYSPQLSRLTLGREGAPISAVWRILQVRLED